jgi:hypothetical protein
MTPFAVQWDVSNQNVNENNVANISAQNKNFHVKAFEQILPGKKY